MQLPFGNYFDAMVLHRTACLQKFNGYTTEPPFDRVGWEDYELTIRYALSGYYGIKAHQPLMAYRVHKGSMIDQIRKNDRDRILWDGMRARFPQLYGE